MLLDENSKRLKIIDFGLSRRLEKNAECRELLGTPEFVGKHLIIHAMGNTPISVEVGSQLFWF